MLSMLKIIGNNNDLFVKYIPRLVNIISYLPYEYFYICKCVCTSWHNYLKSNISKILLSTSKNMYHILSLKNELHHH
jgi:F-box domain.